MDVLAGYNLLISFALSVLFVWLLKPVAVQLGLVDHPGGHKTHTEETPLIGGVAIYLALTITILSYIVGFHQNTAPILPLLVGFLMVLTGAIDDRLHLSVYPRFVVQILAALIMVWAGGFVIRDLGSLLPFWEIELGILAVPVSILAVVGGINAMNMTDGLDGLAGGVAVVTLSALSFMAYTAGVEQGLVVLLPLIGALIGFLFFNARIFGRQRAAIFMGDAGSMLLGLFISWYLIALSQGEERAMLPVTALWLFAFPLIDTVTIIIRRLLRGRSPFAPDNEHFHHILQRAGFSVTETVLIIVALHALMAVVGVSGYYLHIPEYVMFFAFLAIMALHLWGTLHAWRLMKWTRALYRLFNTDRFCREEC